MTPWTVAQQTSLSMEFSRQEYWSGLPFPPPVDLPNPGIEPVSLALASFLTTESLGSPFSLHTEVQFLIDNHSEGGISCHLFRWDP